MLEKTGFEATATKRLEPPAYKKLANIGPDDDEEEWGGFDSPAIHGSDFGTLSQPAEIRKAMQKEKKNQKLDKKSEIGTRKIHSSAENQDLRDSNFKVLNEEVDAEADGKPI